MGKKPQKLYDYTIYVLFFSDGSCFIGKRFTGYERDAYKEHHGLRNHYTAEVFARDKAAGKLPDMFVLEKIRTHHKGFQPYQIAWTQYLLDHGRHLVEGQALLQSYTQGMKGKAAEIYETIKDTPFEEKFSPAKSLFPNYGARMDTYGKNNFEKMAITISVTGKQYNAIRDAAKAQGISMAKYCRWQVVNGKIINIDVEFMLDYLEVLRNDCQLLDRILYTMYMRGETAPADLKNIDRIIKHTDQVYKEALEKFIAELDRCLN